MNPNAGGGRGEWRGQPVSTAVDRRPNFRDLTPYLTFAIKSIVTPFREALRLSDRLIAAKKLKTERPDDLPPPTPSDPEQEEGHFWVSSDPDLFWFLQKEDPVRPLPHSFFLRQLWYQLSLNLVLVILWPLHAVVCWTASHPYTRQAMEQIWGNQCWESGTESACFWASRIRSIM